MTEQEFTITDQTKNLRIDKALTILFPNRSRSYFQKLIADGNVKLNGNVVKAKDLTTVGDQGMLYEPDPKPLLVEAENIPLDIIYEDDDILIVNKPKNMVVHPAPGHPDHTLVNAVMYHCKDSLSSINGVLRPGIVHRIDQDTTGSLIICKNDNAHQKIAEQLAVHSINRRYLGIVHGVLKNDSGTINAPIGRNPNDRKKMAINERNGKPAVTHYKVLKRFHNYTYCEFKLDTGRTHQIRVHMASIGHPLLGDPLYGPRKCPIPHLVGQTLHAWKIGFIHPTTRQYVEFEAPIPEYFQKLLKRTDL
ncbi:RluA family pseudouridine synthase [Lachnospiraceae bacterium YH-ros2228]